MWIGNRVYFLSDRDGPVTLYAYDVGTRAVNRVLTREGFDLMSASGGPDGIILDAFGALELFDPATRAYGASAFASTARSARSPLARRTCRRGGRAPSAIALGHERCRRSSRRRFIAPTDSGARARNLTNTPALAERTVSWSADGSRVAYLSEASGEYQLVVRAADGSGQTRTITLGERPGIFSDFKWSPDGRHIAYRDDRLSMWMLDLETGRSRSPDARRWEPADLGRRTGRRTANGSCTRARCRITWERCFSTLWSRAEVFRRPTAEQTSVIQYSTRVASICISSPVQPADVDVRDDGGVRPPCHDLGVRATVCVPGMPPAGTVAAGGNTRRHGGLRSRVIRLPAPPRAYQSLYTGAPGVVYLIDGNPIGGGPTQVAGVSRSVWRLTWPDRKVEEVLRDADGFELVRNGSTALVRKGGQIDVR